MSDFESLWNEAEDVAEFKTVAQGDYEAVITSAGVESPQDGNGSDKVNIEYTISSGDFKGSKVWSNSKVNAQGMPYIKKDATTLGINIGGIKSQYDLSEALSTAKGKSVKIYVKQTQYNGKTYANPYLNELISNELISSDGPSPVDSNDEIPF